MNKYFIFCLLLIVNMGIASSAFSQSGDYSRSVSRLAAETVNYLEGFSKSTGGNDFEYFSFRNDLTEAMLTRCTDGTMAIEWQTAVVGDDINSGAGFAWIAAVDHTSQQHSFDIFINGEKKFQLTTGNLGNFELTSPDGGKLNFTTVEKDQFGDPHGYMTLWAPATWLKPGKPLTVKILGHSDNSNTWVIIYKAKDALNYLHQSVKYNAWADLEIINDKNSSQVNASVSFSGNLTLVIGKKEYSMLTNFQDGKNVTGLTLKNAIAENTLISLRDNYGEILSINSLKTGKSTKLANKALIQNDVTVSGSFIKIEAVRTYKPNTVNSLNKMAGSGLANGKIYLMNSSHQDIAWMDSPEKCILERDTMLLTPLFSKALADETYRFDVEDALMLKEYIQRHPDRKEDVNFLLRSGRISCGSSFIQPYEELYSGEALVRQFYFGTRWLKKEFGYKANTYWNMDVPGRTLQMPQILRKSGTDYMAISRVEKGVFNWYSPDGSFVTTYSPGHYGNDFAPLQRNFYDAAEYIGSSTEVWNRYFSPAAQGQIIPLLSDVDMSSAKDYNSLISQWNNISEIQAENGKYIPVRLPKIKLMLAPDFMKEFVQNADNIPMRMGERPDVWLYIHGPTHQKAIKASREADILLTEAEKFATANALISNSFTAYPVQQLNDAWEAKIYPDHGWGGKHGETTDALFQEKYYFARQSAESILSAAQNSIASKIVTSVAKGIPLVVFNSLSWVRTDEVKATLTFEKSFVKNFQVSDASGKTIPFQLTVTDYYEDGSLKRADICFIATDIPSVGYKTFYINAAEPVQNTTAPDMSLVFENQFYKIQFADGGVSSLFDKQLNKELLNADKFKGFEIFTLHSEGTGAGEFADIQKTDTEGFDKASNYKSDWKISSKGAIYTEYSNRQPIRNAVVEQKIRVYNTLKRIDVEVNLLNYEGVLYREYRMAVPLNMTDGQVNYEVPFGVLTVGKDELEGAAGERYKTPCKETHPRGISNWIGADNSVFGVTLSSSVAVADYIDPTDQPVANHVLQPILISSRRSCHNEGNEYLQTGDHNFSFSFTSHQPGWENGYRSGMEANEKLRAVYAVQPYAAASLPEELSFFSVDKEDMVISTVKKSEDENAAVIRVYNLSGSDKEVKIKGFKTFGSATHLNLIEEPAGPVKTEDGYIQPMIGKYAIETFLVK